MSQISSLFPVNFSASMLDDLATCELKWFRIHCNKLTNRVKNPDLVAGGLFASACELTRKRYYNDGLTAEQATREGKELILLGEAIEHDLKTNYRMAQVFENYLFHYPLDRDNYNPVKLTNGEAAIEYKFNIDLGIPHPEIPDTNLQFKGKLDGLYIRSHRGRDKELVVTDEKTASSIYYLKGTKIVDVEKEANVYKNSGQFLSYVWGINQLIANNLVDTNLPMNEVKVYKVPITATGTDPIEIELSFNKFQTDLWASVMLSRVQNLVEAYKYHIKHGSIPQRTFRPAYSNIACQSYGRACPYMIGCSSPNGEEILLSSFDQKMWDSRTREEVSLIAYRQQLGLRNG